MKSMIGWRTGCGKKRSEEACLDAEADRTGWLKDMRSSIIAYYGPLVSILL